MALPFFKILHQLRGVGEFVSLPKQLLKFHLPFSLKNTPLWAEVLGPMSQALWYPLPVPRVAANGCRLTLELNYHHTPRDISHPHSNLRQPARIMLTWGLYPILLKKKNFMALHINPKVSRCLHHKAQWNTCICNKLSVRVWNVSAFGSEPWPPNDLDCYHSAACPQWGCDTFLVITSLVWHTCPFCWPSGKYILKKDSSWKYLHSILTFFWFYLQGHSILCFYIVLKYVLHGL